MKSINQSINQSRWTKENLYDEENDVDNVNRIDDDSVYVYHLYRVPNMTPTVKAYY